MARTEIRTASPPPDGPRDGSPEAPAGRLDALRIRDFRLLFIGTVSSGFGQWGQTIGLGWLAFTLSNESATELALVASAGGGARLLAGPAVGVILDRYHRRNVLVWTTLLSALKGVILGVLVVTDLVNMPLVYAFSVLEGLVSTANQNSRQAFVYDVTTDRTLPAAVGLAAIAQNLSRIVGPSIVGVMIGAFGTASPFLFIAVMMTIATLFTLPISKSTRQAARDTEPWLRSLRLGIGYVLHDRALLGLMLTSVVPALFVYPYVQLLPVFAEELGRGAAGYGLLAGAIGWGSLSGLIGLSLYGDVRRKGVVLIWFFIAYVAALIVFTQMDSLALALVMLVVAGLFHGVAMVLSQTLVQLMARNDMRGRTTATFQMGFGLMPLGALPMGLAIDAFGAQRAVAAFMTVALVFFVIQAFTWRSLLRA
ncbi:MAG: MFS transporter [Chloroflexi bacterium]|nr:MFS transporter [Chloroflexota bacterium]